MEENISSALVFWFLLFSFIKDTCIIALMVFMYCKYYHQPSFMEKTIDKTINAFNKYFTRSNSKESESDGDSEDELEYEDQKEDESSSQKKPNETTLHKLEEDFAKLQNNKKISF